MSIFVIQVSKALGYDNIMENRRYENSRWRQKPRDSDHGEVKRGDDLIVYCTGGVPVYGRSIAFRVQVERVSEDSVTFELGEPHWFPSPVKLQDISVQVRLDILPEEFSKCGQQGFNIAKIEGDSWEFDPDLVVRKEKELPDPFSLDTILSDGCFLPQPTLETMLQRLRTKQNIILQGPPGTGKTWLAKRLAYALMGYKVDSNVRPFQFHPNLSYEDFVRGWRPRGDGRLALVDGPFLQVAEDARADPDGKYVMVIEEINRGNPASIFGEMLTLLEADKRSEDEALTLAYPNPDEPGERFHIPDNVYVIGTMNTADRSIAMIDLALRRRFAFFDLEPLLNPAWRNWVEDQCGIPDAFLRNVAQRLNTLNDAIAADPNLGRQFRIGHSHVTPAPGVAIDDPAEWFTQVVETEIAPLLREYWFDDVPKADAAVEDLRRGL